MENMNDIVNKLVEDIDVPEDIPVMYEVWAVGFDEQDELTGASMLLNTFNDPDQAVEYAKAITLADVANMAAEEDYDDITYETHSISVEVETVVPSDDEDELNMNVGTVYKRLIKIYEDTPEFVVLANDEFFVIAETGLIGIPCELLKEHKVGDLIMAIFEEEEEPNPIEFKIIQKTADSYICDFI